jgi:hypothetical protein
MMARLNISHLTNALVSVAVGVMTMMVAPPLNGADASGLNEPVFGNTITIDIPRMYHAVRFIDPDHSWRQVGDDGELRGTWSVEGGDVCFDQTDPKPGPGMDHNCNPNAPHKIGDTWNNTDPVTGNLVVIGLVEGRK